MNFATLSIEELKAIVVAVTAAHHASEDSGKSGTTEHMRLRAIEDKIGALVGEKFVITASN